MIFSPRDCEGTGWNFFILKVSSFKKRDIIFQNKKYPAISLPYGKKKIIHRSILKDFSETRP